MSWVACRQSSKASAGGWGCLEKKEGPFLCRGCATRVQLTILAQQAHPPPRAALGCRQRRCGRCWQGRAFRAGWAVWEGDE